MKTHTREKCTACIPFDKGNYADLMKDVEKFRFHMDDIIEHFPELLPDGIAISGYVMKDIRKSTKLQIAIRRITE